jgi:predicted N-acetyltransferase YhbS
MTSAFPPWLPRLACKGDIPALERLIPLSAHALQSAHYTAAQIEAALGPIFAVDRQLISDGTYFVVEHEGQIIGCGGWSRRHSLFGGTAAGEPIELDPRHDAARVRAFFVHPGLARRGIGRAIMAASEEAIRKAGFRSAELVATLSGEPLYAAFGYRVVRRFDIPLAGQVPLPVVHMAKTLSLSA